MLLAPVSLIDINLGFIGLKAFAAAVLAASAPSRARWWARHHRAIELFSGAYLPLGVKDVAAYVVLLSCWPSGPGHVRHVGRKKV